jgi:hypothetical protein
MEYQIKFNLIELLSKQVAAPPIQEHSQEDFGFNFSVGIKSSSASKTAMVLTNVSIISNKLNSAELANFQTVAIFEFPNFDEIFQTIEPDKYEIAEDLEILLKSIGLSTTRGIIYTEVRGTYLHQAVLPLIDIPNLVKSDRARKKLNQKAKDSPTS